MSLKERFEKLDSKRGGVLSTAEECARLTLRHIFPPQGTDANTYLGKPWQSVGARGVNNLAAKLLLTQLPPDGGFFRYMIDPALQQTLEPDVVKRAEELLALAEEITLSRLNELTLRHTLFEAMKHLIITGNVALWLDLKHNRFKLYSLRDYVVVRDKAQNLVEIVLKETIDRDALPKDIRDFIDTYNIKGTPDTGNITYDEENPMITLYTGFKLKDGKWEMWQEVDGVEVPKSRHTVKRLPVIVLRWTNDVYGRGLVEQVLGDLDTLETLTQAVTKGSMAAAKAVFLVNPTGMTNLKKLAQARVADFVEGNPNDVGVVQMNKYADFRVALERIAVLEDRLNQIFLVFQPRDAERVTAEEIRRLTEELEALLGGVYTLLAEELQKPLLDLIFEDLVAKGDIPPMPKEDIKITLTTGFEALSRTTTLNKLLTMLNAVAPIPQAAQFLNWEEYLSRVLNSLNINPKGLVKSQSELMAEQQMMMQAQAEAQTTAQKANNND